MTNPFIIPEIADLAEQVSHRHFPLARATDLQTAFAKIFSRHLGSLRGGRPFESECLVVTGLSGSGKTKEIRDLLRRFKESAAALPSGQPARIVECILDAKGGWKDLNRKTLKAIGYPISDSSRLTQSALGDKVTSVARAHGVIGVHYDEAQHLFRGKSENDVRIILDAFKTMTKSSEWPLMLFLSGVPELADYVSQEFQLFRLKEHIEFTDIELDPDEQGASAKDYTVIHEIVSSYAIRAGVTIEASIGSVDFYHRLATAAAFRWGLLIELTFKATQEAAMGSTRVLSRDDFVTAWARKANCNAMSTPFTLDAYATIFRREKPFCHSIPR